MWKIQRSEVARAWNEVVEEDSGEKVKRYTVKPRLTTIIRS